MAVLVIRGDAFMCCTTDEQLKSFLDDGYEIVKEKAVEKPKTATKSTRKKAVQK